MAKKRTKSVGKQLIDGLKDLNRKLKVGEDIPCTTLVKHKAWGVFSDDLPLVVFNKREDARAWRMFGEKVEPVTVIRTVKAKLKARKRNGGK